jgi:rubredoxin
MSHRYRCPECAYLYDEALGDRHEGLKPGTRWSSLPEDFACPGCAVRTRDDFERLDASVNDNLA